MKKEASLLKKFKKLNRGLNIRDFITFHISLFISVSFYFYCIYNIDSQDIIEYKSKIKTITYYSCFIFVLLFFTSLVLNSMMVAKTEKKKMIKGIMLEDIFNTYFRCFLWGNVTALFVRYQIISIPELEVDVYKKVLFKLQMREVIVGISTMVLLFFPVLYISLKRKSKILENELAYKSEKNS